MVMLVVRLNSLVVVQCLTRYCHATYSKCEAGDFDVCEENEFEAPLVCRFSHLKISLVIESAHSCF